MINYSFYCKKNISNNIRPVILYYANITWDLTGSYSCSDNGIVWSEDRQIIKSNNVIQTRNGKILTPQSKFKNMRNSRQVPYLTVYLSQNNLNKRVSIHKIIINSFLGRCPKGYETSHIDQNFLNNSLNNLTYETLSNHRIKDKQHLRFCGEKHPRHKLSNDQVKLMRKLFKDKIITNITKLSKKFNCSPSLAWQIIHNKRRKYG